VEVYRPGQDSWAEVSPPAAPSPAQAPRVSLSRPRYRHCAVTTGGGELLLLGGFPTTRWGAAQGGEGARRTVEVLRQHGWQALQEMRQPRG
jgi:hypothetical protein